MWGVRGRALSHPRLPALWAGRRGPLPTGCGCGGLRAWGPVTNPTAGAPSSWLCALWGRHKGARGGRLLPGCGASGVGRFPTPDCPYSGRAAGTHYPLAVGAGGCGRRNPSPTPQRALLRAGFARCGGGTRAPGRGASCLGVGRPGSGALPPPTARPLGGLPGPTTHWLWVREVRAWGPVTSPTARALPSWLCALWGRHEGARGGRLLPGCGASGVGRSPTSDCPPSGRAAGAHYPLAVGPGGCGRGDPSQTPHRALFRAGLARRGGGTRAPAGGRLLPGCRASGVGRSPNPDCPPSGRAAGAHYPLAVGAGGCGRGDPSPTPQRALLRAGFARCGGGMRVPWGAPLAWLWGVRGRALSHPRLPALWAGCRGPLPTGCGCGWVLAWRPVTNSTARALASWLCALWGRHECARGGAPPAWVWGVRCRALSDPRLPALWAGCRGPLPTGCRCRGVRACRPVTNPTSRALSSWLCAPWGRHEGARGGAPPAWVSGVRCRALSHPRLPALWAGCRGPLPTGFGCGGVRAGGPVTNPTARALASWLCALWGRHEGAWGGASCLAVGRPGSGALPPPTARPLGGLPGPTTHWLWVRVGAGVETRHQPHSARSCELALRAVGAARGRPGGAPPAWVWGVRCRALSDPRLPAL